MTAVKAVAAELRKSWDPIGRGQMPDLPLDEYDSYAPALYSLLADGASDERIARHLIALERDIVGEPMRSASDLTPVVRSLRAAI